MCCESGETLRKKSFTSSVLGEISPMVCEAIFSSKKKKKGQKEERIERRGEWGSFCPQEYLVCRARLYSELR